MNSDSENFDQLRRLLALKRHEQPPPGYFDRFSREVVARIKAGDQGEPRATGWVQRLWAALEAKPAFAAAFGAAVCVVLISGILNSEGSGSGSAVNPAQAGIGISPFAPTPAIALHETDGMQSNTSSNTSLSGLFDIPAPNVQPAATTINLLDQH